MRLSKLREFLDICDMSPRMIGDPEVFVAGIHAIVNEKGKPVVTFRQIMTEFDVEHM